MAAHQVKIGPSFFAKVPNDYECWEWAWVREILQNCIDAPGSKNVTVLICEEDGDTHVTVLNDGVPMGRDELVNKLLALGESGKDFAETVGGFGKAKELLLFTHKSWKVQTGHLTAVGCGGDYDLEESDFLYGTRTTVVMTGYHMEDLIKHFNRFAFWAQWNGNLTVNGVKLETSHRKGSPRRDLGFGKVYTNRSAEYRLCVRIGGIPMFVQSTGFDRTVIVELKGASNDVLTANRDGMINPYRNELSDFVTELAVDKRSALKDRRRGPKYREYRGTKLCHRRALDVVELVKPVNRLPEDQHPGYPTNGAPPVPAPVINDGDAPGIDVIDGDEVQAPVYHEEVVEDRPVRAAAFTVGERIPTPRREVATLGHSFVLKNETDLQVPAYYDPGSGEFSSYSMKLARFWGRIMLELHRLFDIESEFSIGFLFSDQDEAQHEQGDYGKVYYLNPCNVVEQRASYSKSFKKRFKLTERDRLIMIGLHELLHGMGRSWHDERYANKLTDMGAKVMANRKRFNWCFK